jgi:LIVCS family branched-chain amino acid:cation transporter
MFNEGLYSGYQTMDLLAAFFFSSIIYDFLKQKAHQGNDQKLFRLSIGSSILGGGILALVYTSLVLLGSLYATKLQGVEPQNMLATISQTVLGDYGLWLVSFILIISCLTTSTVLTKLFSEFLKRDVFKDKVSYILCLKLTLIIAFVLSLTGFQAICKVLGTVLGWSYPLLIVYTIFQIFQKRHDFR